MRLIKWLITCLLLAFIVVVVITSYRNWVQDDAKPARTMDPHKVRLKILNASGMGWVGDEVRDSLRAAGYDVEGVDLSDEIERRTRIIDRVDPKMSFAREIRNLETVPGKHLWFLRVKSGKQPEIECRIDSLLFVDATVLLGRDVQTFFAVNPGQTKQ